MVSSGVVWAEDSREGGVGEGGMDGSAGAIGGGVSVSFARTSACLHVPADDASIGRWRRCACVCSLFQVSYGTM